MHRAEINIGKAVKELRKSRNITKEQLAEDIGISVSHLEKIKAGARRPGIDTYQRLLNILDMDMVIHKEIETKCHGGNGTEYAIGDVERKQVIGACQSTSTCGPGVLWQTGNCRFDCALKTEYQYGDILVHMLFGQYKISLRTQRI